MRALFLLVVCSTVSLAEGPTAHCVLRKDVDGHLPSAAWLGKRFALTWYARDIGTDAGVVSFEQKFALMEPEGELVGHQPIAITPVDGFSSVMGRLRVGPSGVLGLVWQDDASGERTAMFRTLDFNGKPTSEGVAVWKQKTSHGDQAALAWNEKTKQWLVVFQGTEPTERPGYVTHHFFATSFAKGSAIPVPIRLDADESISNSHGLMVEAKGECGVTAWEANNNSKSAGGSAGGIVFATFCGQKVTRQTVSDTSAKAPTQASLGVRPDGSVLVVWVDEAPKETPAPKDAPKPGAPGGVAAPSRPFNAPPPPGLPRRSVVFVLLDASGAVKMRGRFDAGGDAESPVVAGNERGWFVVWSDTVDRKDRAMAARLSPEGNQQGALINLSTPVDGPAWVSVARGGPKSGVLISHSNHPDCAAEWAELR